MPKEGPVCRLYARNSKGSSEKDLEDAMRCVGHFTHTAAVGVD